MKTKVSVVKRSRRTKGILKVEAEMITNLSDSH